MKGIVFGSFQNMSLRLFDQIASETVMQLSLQEPIDDTWQFMKGELRN